MPMLVTGSGEVLTASRIPALVRCDSNAVPPPTEASTIWSSEVSSGTLPASSAPITAPAVGRIRVEIASHVESTYGILSATNSMAYMNPAIASTSQRPSTSGMSE